MSIGQGVANFLSQFRLFNPHRTHGFISGPDRSHFWPDLGWAYKELHGFHGQNLRDPARATAKDVFSYLYSLQYYEILRIATYWRFIEAVTVGAQLRRACEHVKSELKKSQYIHQNRTFEAECKNLIASATDIAADEVMKKFETRLNDDIKKPRWDTSYGHG
jgi:hypothetical protein